MTCARCGNEVPPGAGFCAKCGGTLSNPGHVPSPAEGGPRPPTASTVSPSTAKSGGGCLRTAGCGCLGLIVFLLVVGGGGYFAYRGGLLTTTTVLNLVGRGPGNLELNNFRDDPLGVSITRVEDANKTHDPTSLDIKSLDISAYHAQDPGRYRVEFRATKGATNLGTCTLTVRSGDLYQFVALPDKIVVNRANQPASVGSDFIIRTSSLCR